MKINKTLTAIGAAISVFSNTAVADEKTYFINGTTLERETVYAQWHNAIKNIEIETLTYHEVSSEKYSSIERSTIKQRITLVHRDRNTYLS